LRGAKLRLSLNCEEGRKGGEVFADRGREKGGEKKGGERLGKKKGKRGDCNLVARGEKKKSLNFAVEEIAVGHVTRKGISVEKGSKRAKPISRRKTKKTLSSAKRRWAKKLGRKKNRDSPRGGKDNTSGTMKERPPGRVPRRGKGGKPFTPPKRYQEGKTNTRREKKAEISSQASFTLSEKGERNFLVWGG